MHEEYREKQSAIAKQLGFVKLLPLNIETFPLELFDALWDRIRTADYAFEDTTRDDKALFVRRMLEDGTYNFEIPDRAFGQLTLAGPGTNAMVHFISLQKGSKQEIVEAAQEMFWFAFEKIGVQRITAYIPSFNKKVISLATLMRMKFEGDMRKAFLYHEEYWDLQIYGILASEYKRRGVV